MRLTLERPDGVARSAWAVAHLISRRTCCPRDFAHADIYEYRGRLRDLREAGATIHKGVCERHDHPNNPRMPSYRMIEAPETWISADERQLLLGLA